jgi:hypothetical protein
MSKQALIATVEPYTRFIRVERDKLLSVQEQLDEVSVALQDLRSQIHALT